ncbi:MAG: oligosaccharide flippase family protein [Daejeonella sp.]
MKYFNLTIFRRIINANAFSNFLNLSSVQLYNTLLSFLVYPVILRKVGLEAFGLFIVANYFAALMAVVVNYGTSQSGVKDVVMNGDEPKSLSLVFYNTLALRLIIFISFLLLFFPLGLIDIPNYSFYFFAIPLILSEVLNPMFLYLGKEQLLLFNISNLTAKVITILSIVFLIKGTDDAIWINLILGVIITITYLFLLIFAVVRYRLTFTAFNRSGIIKLLSNNFYLVGNNISVQLQQSLMVFTINLWGDPLWLGTYSICDKIIGSVKMMISYISYSLYPKAAQLFKDDKSLFVLFKNRMKKILFISFLSLSFGIMIFAGLIIHLLNGEPNAPAETLLRVMAFLPAAAALNSFNVLELLIRDKNIFIFKIAMVLLILSAGISVPIVLWGNLYWFGIYTLLIEISAVLMYEYVIRKNRGINPGIS